jgi:uncharacterized protein
MQKKVQIQVPPAYTLDGDLIKKQLAAETGFAPKEISGYRLIRRSLDARSKYPHYILTLLVFINEPVLVYQPYRLPDRDVSRATRTVVIIGAGPAGLFAALTLIAAGIRPILLERGKDVRARRRDLAQLNKTGILNPESNYCFGEGGAGTYSDGKLYTRSNKRGNIMRVLDILVRFGADEQILYDAHPHIGTNKLPSIISAIRQYITASGGLLEFEKKVCDWQTERDRILAVKTTDGDAYPADAFLLATGHSARDIFELLYQKQVSIEAKPFALGIRIEHPQELINSIRYHFDPSASGAGLLPPASYNLVDQVEPKAVFSFCMCPGGIIAPAATAPGELVVNGWSPSKRNNPYANSGIVVNIEEKDWQSYRQHGPLAAMYFQQAVERKAYQAGGGGFRAPAQRMADFVNDDASSSLPSCSYIPGIHSAPLKEVLPDFVSDALRKGFRSFGKKMKGYYTNEAVLVATESRTSSPVRIPRNSESLQHPQLSNLYPCGEGAGYAGGIMSAAMDGENVASMIAGIFNSKQIIHGNA